MPLSFLPCSSSYNNVPRFPPLFFFLVLSLSFLPGSSHNLMSFPRGAVGVCSHGRAWELFRESVLLEDSLLARPSLSDDEEQDSSPCERVNTKAKMVPMGLATPYRWVLDYISPGFRPNHQITTPFLT